MNPIKVLLDGLGRALFWFAFAAFMLAAIPHTAYFFRAWEPGVAPADSQGGLFYWGVAYAIAISVDGMVIYLTRALTVLNKQSRKQFAKAVAGLGIGLLSLLSWFVNWQYAVEFRGAMLDRVLSLAVGPWRLGDIDPILASMFQALIIFYSFISDKVHEPAEKPQEESLDVLRQRAAEAEERARLEASLAAARQQQQAERARSLLRLGKSVLGELRQVPDDEETLERVLKFFRELPHLLEEQHAALAETLLSQHLKLRRREEVQVWRLRAASILTQEARNLGDNDGTKALGSAGETEQMGLGNSDRPEVLLDGQKAEHHATGDGTRLQEDTEHHAADIAQGKIVPGGTCRAHGARGASPQQNPAQTVPSTEAADPAAGRRTLTIKEVAALTGYSEKYVRDLRRKGVLKTAPRNNHLLLVTSVNALVQTRQNHAQKRGVSPVLAEEGHEQFQGRTEQAYNDDVHREEARHADHYHRRQDANDHA